MMNEKTIDKIGKYSMAIAVFAGMAGFSGLLYEIASEYIIDVPNIVIVVVGIVLVFLCWLAVLLIRDLVNHVKCLKRVRRIYDTEIK